MKIDPETYRKTFFDEAAEHLAALEGALLRLLPGVNGPESIAEAFRAVHSVKGAADAVGFPAIAQFSHAFESLLDQFRSRSAPVPRQMIDLLLESSDTLNALVTAARNNEVSPPGMQDVLERLKSAQQLPLPGVELKNHSLVIRPHPEAFRSGLDPVPLLKELAAIGTLSDIQLDTSALPGLQELDPERCYLSWKLKVETAQPRAAIEEVFAFAGDMIQVAIESPKEHSEVQEKSGHGSSEGSFFGSQDNSVLEESGDLSGEFCTEADDHLQGADRHLLTIDGDPTNNEALNAVYRGFHTIKGVSSMLGLSAIQVLAHEAENLLNQAREGNILLQGKALDLAFASLDGLKRQVQFIRNWMTHRGTLEQDPALPALIAELRSLVSGLSPRETSLEPPPQQPSSKPVSSVADSPIDTPPGEPVSAPEKAAPPVASASNSERTKHRASIGEKETVRVDRDRLDKLINTIGELVIAQSMAQEEFDEHTRRTGRHSRALPELSKISRDLQELSLSLRMVPLQGIFQKMNRLVRDLSRKVNKPVELEMHGEETELDKTVVDQLGDPLMHMVRNAVDHGLESQDERAASGKPREGRLTLRAYHQGGNVYIELTDDGKGLDRERILRKGIEKGLVEESQRLTDAEIYALIFEPGFSTAKAVTDVSGRGVGMDVVRRNVQALQGSIHIRTQVGKGTTFTIRLPLTLAIMDGLMVGLGDDVYVLPLLSVVESFRPQPGDVHIVAARGEVVTVRGEIVPLLRLNRLLGRASQVEDPCMGIVVLVEDQGKKHALLVDELLGQMQAVVKSLDANFRRVDGLAGATILGDGRVAMILDVHGLSQMHSRNGGGATRVGLAELANTI